MESSKTITSKNDIIDALQYSFQEISTFLESVPEEIFHQRHNDKWSIAENLDHLILSNKPIASVLKKNKLFFTPFGFSFKGSTSLENLKDNYHLKLKTIGPPPNSSFKPKGTEANSKKELLDNWKTIAPKYAPRLEKWSEKNLDRFRIPHPLLGKLTFREMLFFTIFHNEHHLDTMKNVKAML